MTPAQNRLGEIFRNLHSKDIFVMPNAWDAGSARMLAGAGYSAIGTTSAGIAFAAGLPDHQIMSKEDMLSEVKSIVDSVGIPVSADLEGGYGIQPSQVAETVKQAIGIGVVGCNIEDLSGDPSSPLLDVKLATERIHAIRKTADQSGVPFTLTARTDTFLTNHPNAMEEAIARCNSYKEAGADCLFIPGIGDPQTIGTLVRSINGPLNVVMGLSHNQLTVEELRSLGVRRISIGGSLARACFHLIRQAALEIKNSGSFTYADHQYSHKELCDFFAEYEANTK